MRFPKPDLEIMSASILLLIANLQSIVQAALIAKNMTIPPAQMEIVKTDFVNVTTDQQHTNNLQTCEGNVTIENKLICELYKNLSASLNNRKVDLAAPIEMTGKQDPENICLALSELLKEVDTKNNGYKDTRKLLDNSLCMRLCTTMVNETTIDVKQICRKLLQGYRQLLSADTSAVIPEKSKKLELHQEHPNEETKKAADAAIISDRTANISSGTNETTKESINKELDANSDIKSPIASEMANDQKEQQVAAPSRSEELNDVFPDDENEKKNNANLTNENAKTSNRLEEEQDDDISEELEAAAGEDIDTPSQQQQSSKSLLDNSNDNNLDKVQLQELHEDPFFEESDSYFFSYFLLLMFVCILCYVAYHNKTKLFALLLEGRRANSGRGGFSKGRKHTAAYRKLDSNLEEAITSSAAANTRTPSQIIY